MNFDQIYKENVGLLLHITKGFGCSKEQGEEIVQDVFLKFYEQQPVINEGALRSYLAVMTKNKCLDLWRSQKSRKTDSVDEFKESDQLKSMWESDIEKSRMLQSVYTASLEISENPGCEEFKKYYLDGITLASIALAQGEPKGTIQARVHRCRKKFEQRIRQIVVNIYDEQSERV